MMTPKEIMLELLRPDGKPERQLVQYEALEMVVAHPIGAYIRPGFRPGASITDLWGVRIDWPLDAPGAMPHVTQENKVIKDITRWRDYVHAPDILASCSGDADWEPVRTRARANAGDSKLVTGFIPTGIFEQCHNLMPFQEVLTNLYDHPQEMHELIAYINEYRMKYVKLMIDKLQPDAIFAHDDWGTKDALFMKPDMWREFFKEPYREFYEYIRSRGVIAIHHADSYLVPIVEDMAEIGIQVWQGTLPENDIPALQQRLQGRLVLMGGIGASIDRADAAEDEVRDYVRTALETYCPGGHFIPCITYGLAGAVFRHIDPWIDDEIQKYNSSYHLPRYLSKATVRRSPVKISDALSDALPETLSGETGTLTDAGRSAGKAIAASPLLDEVSEMLQDGSVNMTLAAVQTALDAGLTASEILNDGLVRGMNELGEDFSAGEVFVPEMLRAAACMSAATDILKPLLTAGNTGGPAGRVVLGTVKGDLHDIGKNLVKIMMEGSGLEVIDLGCDIPAEDFVEAAIENDCKIIACSTLLTTCMDEIRNVVKLAQERDIRDKVKILIGGAPVSQEFCDNAGADLYTPDAAAAARAAVQMLSGLS